MRSFIPAIAALSLLTVTIGAATLPDTKTVSADDATTSVTDTATTAEASGSIPYNRRIDGIGFSIAETGQPMVHVEYSFDVNAGGQSANLAGEIMVEVILNGTVIGTGIALGGFDFFANPAITCAVTCASSCGSIFGDGVCTGCGCSYDRVASLPLAVPQGATVRASLLTFGSPEIDTSDDQFEVVFGIPGGSCDEDLDGDGIVGIGDLLRLLAKWGSCS